MLVFNQILPNNYIKALVDGKDQRSLQERFPIIRIKRRPLASYQFKKKKRKKTCQTQTSVLPKWGSKTCEIKLWLGVPNKYQSGYGVWDWSMVDDVEDHLQWAQSLDPFSGLTPWPPRIVTYHFPNLVERNTQRCIQHDIIMSYWQSTNFGASRAY